MSLSINRPDIRPQPIYGTTDTALTRHTGRSPYTTTARTASVRMKGDANQSSCSSAVEHDLQRTYAENQ
jgi:hypothetical protein